MTANFTLIKEKSALLVLGIQEDSFGYMERPCEVLHSIQQAIKGFQILQLPIFVAEQNSKKYGATISPLKDILGPEQEYWHKTTFSCLSDVEIQKKILAMSIHQWILIGIEAHICILQTAKGLIQANKQVVVLNDAITSSSIYEFSTAIAELRDNGVRISSTETVLYELLHDSRAIGYDEIDNLVK